MESLKVLLKDLECVSLRDISTMPLEYQPAIVEHLEQLQDELKAALRTIQANESYHQRSDYPLPNK